MGRIRIVIPFYNEFESVKPGLRSLLGSGIEYDFIPVQGPRIGCNRNAGVNNLRSNKTRQSAVEGYSHFLFLDSDISFAPAHVHMALKADVPVFAFPYFRHENDGLYQVGELAEGKPRIEKRYGKADRGLREVTFVGGGFLLVKREIFGAIGFPWFHESILEVGPESFSVGSDVMFSHKVREAGISITCDLDHVVPHRLRRKSDFNVGL